MYIYIPSLLHFLPTPSPYSIQVITEHRAELSCLCHTPGSCQLSILHMVVYLCQIESPNSSHPLFPPLCPHVPSLCLHLSIPSLEQKFLFSAIQLPVLAPTHKQLERHQSHPCNKEKPYKLKIDSFLESIRELELQINHHPLNVERQVPQGRKKTETCFLEQKLLEQ